MEKQELLAAVRSMAAQNTITKEELTDAFESGIPKSSQALTKRLNSSDLLYYIGGAIVFVGISILIGQNWEYLNGITRILVTLGSAIAAYFVGIMFLKDERTVGVAHAFFLISALLSPLGVFVTFDQAGINVETPGIHSVISAILVAFYLGSYYIFKKNVFLLFGIFFSTWLFFAFTEFLVNGTLLWDFKFFEYRGLIASLSYLLLGYAFSQTDKRSLTGALYGFGSLGFLSFAMALQGYKPTGLSGAIWEILYPFIAMGFILLSTKLKSKAFWFLALCS